MCGIAGVINEEREKEVTPNLIKRMCASIRHRGPDDEGFWVEKNVGLGMRRLSVIDLESGHQPIFNEDESVVVVFNGEIYNYRELRESLGKNGHRFKTGSDTEVIVHLYEDLGENLVTRLRGMFAIALWDRRERKLLLIRDRIGVKPLFYYLKQGKLVFGSEIKTILQEREVERRVDFRGIDQLLSYGYTIPPTSCFENIYELPPASLLIFRDGDTETRKYWRLNFKTAPEYDERDSLARLEELIKESVRYRMISDVPLGAFLSGGIDSSLIVAIMSGISSKPVKTFSIGFGESDFSELPYARLVAEKYSTDHHELVVKPDIVELLPDLIKHHDIPFYDSSAIPTYHVCKMARESVTVALSGDGGDELFAGYNVYPAARAAEIFSMVPQVIREFIISPLINLIPETGGYTNKGRVAREFARAASLTPGQRYDRWNSKIKPETRKRLYREAGLVNCLNQGSLNPITLLFSDNPETSYISRMLYVDTNTELPNQVLQKVDRMSMAASLEVRSPLLDHTLFEFASGLPDNAKLKGWQTKFLLKKLASKYLPPDLLNRPKRGFSIPLDSWFRGRLAPFVQEILYDSKTRQRGLFHSDSVEMIVNDHIQGKTAYGREIWMLLVTELWFRMYIDSFDYVTEQI